jgi:hypothetical protein
MGSRTMPMELVSGLLLGFSGDVAGAGFIGASAEALVPDTETVCVNSSSTRIPKNELLRSGAILLRYALRMRSVVSFQEPPRKTREDPDSGPSGLAAGPDG